MLRLKAVPVLALVVVAALLLVAGCAKQAPEQPTGPPPQEQPPEPAPPQPEPEPRDGRINLDEYTIPELQQLVEKRGLLRDINFDFDKHELRYDATHRLRQNADFLRDYPTIRIQIEGHCDERGTNEYNLALGDRRAHAAKAYLERLGVYSGRMGTISYGEERPLDPRSNEDAWARNRRAHFRIIAK